jgi:imidazolonepropionase
MAEQDGSGAMRVPTLLTLAKGAVPRRGTEMEARAVHDGVIAWSQGVITYAGPAGGFDERGSGLEPQVRPRACVIPGFVDCHTHLPFFGWRTEEFEARLAGRTYRDLHGEGGIYRSARLFADASDEEVIAFCAPLMGEMLAHGTTAVELKTGYGLSVEAEIRQARLARRLGAMVEQTCRVTLLACHAVPTGMERSEWVRSACEELIPAAAGEGLVDAVDVYVEDIAFSLDDLAAVGEAARLAGLPLRCHADQLGPSGAAEAAVGLGAACVDHLNHLSPEGIRALAGADTVATLLPASTFFLRAPEPPVRQLLDAGAAIAIATDFNPGTSPILSMPEVVAMSCSVYGLVPPAALTAATANPARVLGLDDRLGSLAPRMQADFLVLDGEDFTLVPYRPGHNPVVETWIAGRRVWSRA